MRCFLDISGDDTICFTADLSDEQIEGVRKLLQSVDGVTGPYTPAVSFSTEREEKERAAKSESSRLSQALGLDQKAKTAMQLAFEKAQK